jgi:hypothetical protein
MQWLAGRLVPGAGLCRRADGRFGQDDGRFESFLFCSILQTFRS